ncbi:MAG: dockerin type I domain-containing protein, partial [Planctomycetota bacterium]
MPVITNPGTTKTGAYRATVQGVANGNANTPIGIWNADTPVLINNSHDTFDLAPGWTLPFQDSIVVGTIGGGDESNDDDYGATLFRSNQSASYFETRDFKSPAETFAKLTKEGSEYVLTHPDGSKQVFGAAGVATGVATQNQFWMSESHDAAGNVTQFVYSNGKIQSVIDPLGRRTTFTWQNNINTDSGGYRLKNRLSVTDWHDRTTTYEYFVSSPNVNRSPYMLITHPTPDDIGVLESADALHEVYVYDNQGYITRIVRGSDPRPTANSGQITQFTYKNYFGDPSFGHFRRIDRITNPDGSTFQVNHLGMEDALPNPQGGWLDDNQWQQLLDTSELDRRALMGTYWTDAWNVNNNDGPINKPNIYTGVPRSGLRSFNNYSSYVINGSGSQNPNDPADESGREYEMVMDRRGRLSAMEDPLGNVTTYERKLEYMGDSDEVRSDRGEVTKIIGPDPDRRAHENGVQFSNGPLQRPETTYEYLPGTPFISFVRLPDTQGTDSREYSIRYDGYVAGQPTRTTDELGVVTQIDRTNGGVPTRVFNRPENDTLSWTNQLDRYDVNDDGRVSASDALFVINRLGRHIPGDDNLSPRTQPGPFYDVNGDNRISPQDALWVINELGRSGCSLGVTR